MKTIVERELKLALPDEAAWAAVREELAVVGVSIGRVLQTNIYFDTRDRRIRNAQRMVRVREAGGSYEVTTKDRQVVSADGSGARERTDVLTPEQANTVLSGAAALTALPVDLCRALLAEIGDHLYAIGGIQNTRDTFELPSGYQVELDRTEFPGERTDYEIEMELLNDGQSLEGARTALAAVITVLDVRDLPAARSKYRRFLDAARAEGG